MMVPEHISFQAWLNEDSKEPVPGLYWSTVEASRWEKTKPALRPHRGQNKNGYIAFREDTCEEAIARMNACIELMQKALK